MHERRHEFPGNARRDDAMRKIGAIFRLGVLWVCWVVKWICLVVLKLGMAMVLTFLRVSTRK